MKQLAILAAFAISVTAAPAFAQDTHTQGDKVVNASVGLFGFAGAYGNTSIPPLSLGYDYELNDRISFGGLVGIARSSYDFYNYYSVDYTYILVGATGTYHYDYLIKDALKGLPLDPYARLILGYNIVSSSVSSSNSGLYSASESGSYLLFGGSLGARYWFTPKLAGQVELGYGVGLLSLGIAYKI